MGTAKDSEKTRSKIIQAAGKLFAQHGLKGVTVRTIVQVAETHLSALNYHFKSKDALYEETLSEACQTAAITDKDRQQLLALSPLDALYILVRESLKEYARQSADNWEIALINRECHEPSEAFEQITEAYLKPETEFLARIVARVVKKDAGDSQVQLAVIMLMALLEMFGLYGHLIEVISPDVAEKMNKGDWLTRQIVHIVIEAATTEA